MPKCPDCQAHLADDFGLVNCGSCGLAVFIGMDGEIQAESLAPPPLQSESASDAQGEDSSDWNQVDHSQFETPDESSGLDNDNEGIELNFGEPSGDSARDNQQEYMVDALDEVGEEPYGAESYSNEFNSTESQQFSINSEDAASGEGFLSGELSGGNAELVPDVEAPTGQLLESNPQEDSLRDVVSFANSEVSSATEGSLRVKIEISGIDDIDLREQLQYSLDDARFFIDTKEIMSQVEAGKLILTGLSPVKASVLISRLKAIKLNVRWEQYAIQQSEGVSEELGSQDDSIDGEAEV